MPLNMSVLQGIQNIQPITVPDPVEAQQVIANARTQQRQGRMQDLQIQSAESNIADEQAAKEKAAAIHQIMIRSKGVLDDETIRQINQLDHVLGNAMDKARMERRDTESQIKTREGALDETKRKNMMDSISEMLQRQMDAKKPIKVGPNESLINPGETQPFFTQTAPTTPRNIDPLSPEGIKARVEIENATRVQPKATFEEQEYSDYLKLEDSSKFGKDRTGFRKWKAEATPTADMRNKADARVNATKAVLAIEELSKKLINKTGIAQRATAAGRSIEAVLGEDPEYRTYQDSRTALAGNLAVLQQGSRVSDADVKALWLPMVPDMFRDTKESAEMKWTLIKQMSGLSDAPASAPSAPKSGFRIVP